MKKNKLTSTALSLAKRLQTIDFDGLPISDYNKEYIRRLKPALGYYMKIYTKCLLTCLKENKDISSISLIDYGGGSGFLSMLAKEIGIKQVIYIDLNPLSVQTIEILKQETGLGPDIILHGNSDTLLAWCEENKVKPDFLIATDLIEHIYDLSSFFKDLTRINDNLQMVFTTASTPFNPYVKRRLHKLMMGCEFGSIESPNYYTLRILYIQKDYPDFTIEEVKKWGFITRGLIYSDIKKAIDSNTPPILSDKYNTCDPATGNWTERILPIKEYDSLLSPYGYSLTVNKGFYNTDRKNPVLSFVCHIINTCIFISGKAGLFLAPFIILSFKKTNR